MSRAKSLIRDSATYGTAGVLAKADDVPAYVVFHDTTLHEIAARRPASREELSAISGVGPTKLERYADDLLEALAATG